MKSINSYVQELLPKSGWQDLCVVYINWAGVGFISVFAANLLDKMTGVNYAAYYTDAVNNAIGFKFWLLISSIGLILFLCLLPIIALLRNQPDYQWLSEKLRFFNYMFFLVAFDEGALMIGILFGTLFGISDRADLIISKSFLFSDNSFAILLAMILANSLLWWLGESIYNRIDKSFSGLVNVILNSPLKFSIPSYLVITCSFIALLLHQY